MGAVAETVSNAVSGTVKAVGSVVKGVGDIVESVAKPVFKAAEKTIDAALEDPIGTAAMVTTAIVAPQFLPLVSAANSAAHGASLEQIATGAAISYAGGQAGLQAAGTVPIEYAPLVQQAASGATRAAITGGDITQGALTSVINGQGNSALNNAVNGTTSSGGALPTTKEAEYTPAEPTSSSDTSQFTGLADTKPVDYSLFKGLTGTEPGFKAKLDETTVSTDTPVDYSINTAPTTAGNFDLTPVPGLKSMNGGTGLTLKDAEGGTYGALGYTPPNATYAIGDPNSFINDPNVTGTPLVQTDTSWNIPLPKFNFAGMLGLGNTGNQGVQTGVGGTQNLTAQKKTPEKYGLPSLLDGSELIGDSTGDPYYLERLRQLYGSITPNYQTASTNPIADPTKMATGGSASSSTTEDPFPIAKTPVVNQPFIGGGQRKNIQMAPLQQLKPQITQPRMASGGLPSKYAQALPQGHKPEFITGLTGYYASGKGTGQSDDIDAMLHDGDYVADADLVAALGDGSSKAGAEALEKFRRQVPHQQHAEGGQPVAAKIADGEYVFPASFVTAIGQGDNKAGAKILDKMREAIREHKRSAPTTKIPPKAKSPLEYLKMVKG